MTRRVLLVLAAAAVLGVGIAAASSGHSREAVRLTAAAPTWDAAAPLFAEKCASCHRIGGIAPFSLDEREERAAARPGDRVDDAAAVMPPWMPGTDSPDYQGRRGAS